MQGLAATCSAVCQWWSSKDDDKGGVPILPEEEQLPIQTLQADVTFTCVGQPVELLEGRS
jgi:hypothetical protein